MNSLASILADAFADVPLTDVDFSCAPPEFWDHEALQVADPDTYNRMVGEAQEAAMRMLRLKAHVCPCCERDEMREANASRATCDACGCSVYRHENGSIASIVDGRTMSAARHAMDDATRFPNDW